MKHRKIIVDMVEKEFITRINEPWGSKNIIKYRVSEKGREILKEILEPYEMLFPRSDTIDDDR
jgi:DNA-binding PadR family transcriptional regulator